MNGAQHDFLAAIFAMIERTVIALARGIALAGGCVLLLVILMTVASITGRSLVFAGFAPVSGDFELVEIGAAFAIFAFMPWCHLRGGHARVDFLTRNLDPRLRHALDTLSDALMLGAAILIAWRLAIGMLDKKAYRETTFILELPLWWAYAGSLVGASAFVAVSAYCLWLSLARRERPAA